MTSVTVAPSLVLDDEMFELARAALAARAPEQVEKFTWERFTARKSWVLVPDTENRQKLDDPWYKAEFVIKHGKPYRQTVKLNIWRFPDLRRDGAPMPHNHPWPFVGHVLLGGYEEDRYEVASNSNKVLIDPFQKWEVGGTNVTSGVLHQAGEANDLPLDVFHEVTQILDPGRTVSLMDCDLGRKDGWGHLEEDDKGNLVYVPNKLGELDTRFKPMLRALNPHLR